MSSQLRCLHCKFHIYSWRIAPDAIIWSQSRGCSFGTLTLHFIRIPPNCLARRKWRVNTNVFTSGYGVGPMLWSPLSEIPKVGRAGIYFWTLLLFVLFQLAVGFAPNVAVFLVFRWITGFYGSPCLSNGGNTVVDIYTQLQVLYIVVIWSSAGLLGPIFGPVIGGFIIPAVGWRWTIWVFTWLCSLILIVMFFFSPETGGSKILYERAKRLLASSHTEIIIPLLQINRGWRLTIE